MKPFKATKKPVTIEVMQFTAESKNAVYNWVNGNKRVGFDKENNPTLGIQTLEGEMRARIGDYIIKGVNGEFYPCKPDVFEKTYDFNCHE